MKPKQRRMILIGLGMLALAGAAALTLTAFEENLVFFYSPSDLAEREMAPRRPFRLGGLVEEDSFKKLDDGLTFAFRITDLANSVPVTYRGILPDLFREGQGVVSQGTLGPDGVFVAQEVLAKHDENYMPPEVAEALRESGQWRGEEDGQ
jgi:cytochrome c-type biogenesis protein CcmE